MKPHLILPASFLGSKRPLGEGGRVPGGMELAKGEERGIRQEEIREFLVTDGKGSTISGTRGAHL